jgi:hypothetical protein
MSSAEEWKQYKLKSLQRLRALTVTFADYTPPSAEWDHDHCEGCWATFALFDAPEILHAGYFTTVQMGDESKKESEIIQQARESGREVLAKPDTKRWVCQGCINEFSRDLDWKLNSKEQI